METIADKGDSLRVSMLAITIPSGGGAFWVGAARIQISIEGGKIRARIAAPRALPIIRDGSSVAVGYVEGLSNTAGAIPEDLDRNLIGPWILERQDCERYEDSDETSWVREGLPSAELAPLAQEVANDPNLRAVNLLSGEVACWHESPEAPKPPGFVRHAACRDCYGSGDLLCWQCDGSGEECRSRAEEVLGGRVCHQCGGYGAAPCRSCKGTGRIPVDALGAPLI